MQNDLLAQVVLSDPWGSASQQFYAAPISSTNFWRK
jgi:hypothetical protein